MPQARPTPARAPSSACSTVAPARSRVDPARLRFRVELLDGEARGYVCENYGALFRLPELGPIGANGLANSARLPHAGRGLRGRRSGDAELVQKFLGRLWATELDHSPLDVVAWHGNLAPYKYDLARFNTINTVSFDHPDPSIFTVLTSPSRHAGHGQLDFVIFPPRWMVAEHTFRPPWFHRNVMSEFMGLVHGAYDAKAEGFVPGGVVAAQLHVGARPDARDLRARDARPTLAPHKIEDTLAFMFEIALGVPRPPASRWRPRRCRRTTTPAGAGFRRI